MPRTASRATVLVRPERQAVLAAVGVALARHCVQLETVLAVLALIIVRCHVALTVLRHALDTIPSRIQEEQRRTVLTLVTRGLETQTVIRVLNST